MKFRPFHKLVEGQAILKNNLSKNIKKISSIPKENLLKTPMKMNSLQSLNPKFVIQGRSRSLIGIQKRNTEIPQHYISNQGNLNKKQTYKIFDSPLKSERSLSYKKIKRPSSALMNKLIKNDTKSNSPQKVSGIYSISIEKKQRTELKMSKVELFPEIQEKHKIDEIIESNRYQSKKSNVKTENEAINVVAIENEKFETSKNQAKMLNFQLKFDKERKNKYIPRHYSAVVGKSGKKNTKSDSIKNRLGTANILSERRQCPELRMSQDIFFETKNNCNNTGELIDHNGNSSKINITYDDNKPNNEEEKINTSTNQNKLIIEDQTNNSKQSFETFNKNNTANTREKIIFNDQKAENSINQNKINLENDIINEDKRFIYSTNKRYLKNENIDTELIYECPPNQDKAEFYRKIFIENKKKRSLDINYVKLNSLISIASQKIKNNEIITYSEYVDFLSKGLLKNANHGQLKHRKSNSCKYNKANLNSPSRIYGFTTEDFFLENKSNNISINQFIPTEKEKNSSTDEELKQYKNKILNENKHIYEDINTPQTFPETTKTRADSFILNNIEIKQNYLKCKERNSLPYTIITSLKDLEYLNENPDENEANLASIESQNSSSSKINDPNHLD